MTKTTISTDFIHALRRKRGDENISVLELSRQSGVSRWTLDNILAADTEIRVFPSTIAKLNAWLYTKI
ncbi:helix-turn-helix domain-containing protein [Lacticaseibacillus sharpeae]|uniref:helix-turn-helix domain-containing protein n=1 Tax=Lacticaseibacillus sharpeae TaxID=1626 RepID=UPI0007048BD8|nr:hypothetical protein [Lacticaseibacillus sharpeae]